jgi:serine/threonine-protein kinase
VTDFGLSRSVSDPTSQIVSIEGTAPFMAPEQVSAWWGPLSVRTDVYGMGAVLYDLLTGRPPYHGATLTDILSRVVSGVAIPSPKQFRPELPASLVDACMRCLAKRPSERFEDLGQLERALKHTAS